MKKVKYDPNLCIHCLLCTELNPEFFNESILHSPKSIMSDLPIVLEADFREIEELCPGGAIKIISV